MFDRAFESWNFVMKRTTFAIIFFSTHVLFILLTIHKQNLFISLSYEKQKNEQLCAELQEKKTLLSRNYHALTSPIIVKDFAKKNLQMESVALSQVRKLHP
jgi:hypothetical protein